MAKKQDKDKQALDRKKRREYDKEPTEFEKGWADLKEEYNLSTVVVFLIGTFFVSSFISGIIIQMFRTTFKLQESIGLLSAFRYGILSFVGLPLTLLFTWMIAFGVFRMNRRYKKNYHTDRTRNYDIAEDHPYGSAEYQREPEREKCWFRGNEPKDIPRSLYILGRGINDGLLYALRDDLVSMNGHMAIFGSSGAGKSAALVKNMIYQALEKGKSLIVTDSKGDLYADTAYLAKKHGYDVKVLNLKSTELQNSDGCDMLKTLGDDSVKASQLAETIIMNTAGSEGLDYWANNEMNILTAFLLYVSTNEDLKRAKKNNLAEVYNLISTKSLDEIHTMFGMLDDEHPAKSSYNIFKQAEPKIQGQIMNGLGIRLQILGNKWAKKIVSSDEIDLLGPMNHKCLYYVVISDMDTTFKFIASMFFSLLFIELCDLYDKTSQRCRKTGEKVKLLPVDFILDEYANTGAINGMNQKISTVRSRQIGITMILQDKGQLEEMYTERIANTILNNIPVKVLLKTTDIGTAKYFSDLMGVQTIKLKNKGYKEQSTQIFHGKDEYKVSEGYGKRMLENPDELINSLDPNHLVVLVSGFHPIKLKKYLHFEHPTDKLCKPSVPSEHVPKWRKAMMKKENPQETEAPELSPDTEEAEPNPVFEATPGTKSERKKKAKRALSGEKKPQTSKHVFDDDMFPED